MNSCLVSTSCSEYMGWVIGVLVPVLRGSNIFPLNFDKL